MGFLFGREQYEWGNVMKIKKILNNNVAIALNEDRTEVVVMGKGLAFKAKAGEELDPAKIDNIFTLKKKEEASRYEQLLNEIPQEYFDMTEQYVDYAKRELEKDLNNSIYITMTDHINTMVERARIHAYIKNPLLWDIKRLYRAEFEVAREIIDRFNQQIGSVYDDNEAASITMHLVNAEFEVDFETTMNITSVITEILNIVKYQFRIVYDEDSMSYYRFVIHLRFFAQRLFSDTSYQDGDDEDLWEYLQMKYKKAYQCALVICEFILNTYQYQLSNEECMYLTIHIAKVVKDSKVI